MNAQELLDKLAPLQAAKGFHFNPDTAMVLDLMAGLLTNKERYGYMACPCRLANGKREMDQDIICPCTYREPDVAEFGACYCGLYVSKALADSDGEIPDVPERRPPSNIHILG